MQKKIKNLEFAHWVNFDFFDSLKNNGTNYLLFFDDSCVEICNSKAFVDIAIAGRHRGLSTIYIEHNLFHQSRLGRDVELQNTHNVLFVSSWRNASNYPQHTVGSWFGTSWLVSRCNVCPFAHLLIDLSPRTDDRLRYCKNSGSVPS